MPAQSSTKHRGKLRIVAAGQAPAIPGPVAKVYDSFPPGPRRKLLQVRQLIFASAAALPEVGPLVETLKWGQPSYLPAKPRIGTTVRLGWREETASDIQMFVHCQTNLVDTYRTLVGDALTFEGNRAINIPIRPALPTSALRLCIQTALTYHLNK